MGVLKTMCKYFLVYTILFNTRYFIALCKTKKEALEIAAQHKDAKIKVYRE